MSLTITLDRDAHAGRPDHPDRDRRGRASGTAFRDAAVVTVRSSAAGTALPPSRCASRSGRVGITCTDDGGRAWTRSRMTASPPSSLPRPDPCASR